MAPNKSYDTTFKFVCLYSQNQVVYLSGLHETMFNRSDERTREKLDGVIESGSRELWMQLSFLVNIRAITHNTRSGSFFHH